ncbi:hypothetical protein DRQ25_13460 [Candidatus Fermentibacteria bacterium]|nr:MAG: hypothetical protein DRQ25_13460 [Candidatus Fermentibacteria bacterium]
MPIPIKYECVKCHWVGAGSEFRQVPRYAVQGSVEVRWEDNHCPRCEGHIFRAVHVPWKMAYDMTPNAMPVSAVSEVES